MKDWAESNADDFSVFYFQYFDKETSENQVGTKVLDHHRSQNERKITNKTWHTFPPPPQRQDDICNNFFGLASAEGDLKFDISDDAS